MNKLFKPLILYVLLKSISAKNAPEVGENPQEEESNTSVQTITYEARVLIEENSTISSQFFDNRAYAGEQDNVSNEEGNIASQTGNSSTPRGGYDVPDRMSVYYTHGLEAALEVNEDLSRVFTSERNHYVNNNDSQENSEEVSSNQESRETRDEEPEN